MFPFGIPLSPPSVLPRPVPPFPGETSVSYLHRLARANKIRPADLQAHLTGTRHRGPVSVEALAAATGRPPHVLLRALPELQPGFDPADGYLRRSICWRCAANREAFRFAVTWKPAEINLCRSHPVWLGPPVRSGHGRQYDIGDAPEIIRAQQHHRKLARQHGRHAAALASGEAAPITALWARHGFHPGQRTALIRAILGRNPYSARLPPGDPATTVVTYPQTVELARVLAMPRWRAPASPAADDLRQFQHDVIAYTGIDYQPENSPYDPLFRWYQKHHPASSGHR